MVDREKLSKILVNLMGNAIKYARTRIDLKLVTTDAGYEIYVSDDGRGVPDAQKGKIFEAFYQMPMIKSLPPQVPVSDWLLRNLWQKPIKAACALKITNRKAPRLYYLFL